MDDVVDERLFKAKTSYSEQFLATLSGYDPLLDHISIERLMKIVEQQFDPRSAEIIARRLLGQLITDIADQMKMNVTDVNSVLTEAPKNILPPVEDSLPLEENKSAVDVPEVQVDQWHTIGLMAERLGKSYDWVQLRINKQYRDLGELRPDSQGRQRVYYPYSVFLALKAEKDGLGQYPIVTSEDLALNALSSIIGKDEKWIAARQPYLEIEGTTKLNPINNRLFVYYKDSDRVLLQAEVERMNQYELAGEDDATESGLARAMGHDLKWIRRRLPFVEVTSTIKMNPKNYKLGTYYPLSETVEKINNIPNQYPTAGEDDATESGLAHKMGHSLKWLRRRLSYIIVTPTVKMTPENNQPRFYYPVAHTIGLIEALPEHIDHLKPRRVVTDHPAEAVAINTVRIREPLPILTWNGGTELVTVENWRDFGECLTTDPEIFMPDKGGSTKTAKQICGRCAARLFCLDYAIATNQREGVWGGKSDRERRAIRKGQT